MSQHPSHLRTTRPTTAQSASDVSHLGFVAASGCSELVAHNSTEARKLSPCDVAAGKVPIMGRAIG